MSVKASWFQIGLSNTANLNFHWRNLLDGVLRLTRGNAGTPIADVMLVNADNSVAFPGGVSSGVLGAGQTWQDVTGDRVKNVVYTNSTGWPIYASVSKSLTASVAVELLVNGLLVAKMSAGTVSISGTLSAIIPAGATYEYRQTSGTATITDWSELR